MTPKPANGWAVRETFSGMWAAFPSDVLHPDWDNLYKHQDSLVHACEYTNLIGPLSNKPGEIRE